MEEGFTQAKKIAAEVIKVDVRAGIGGDEQRIDSIKTHYSAITFKHLLLPIYAGAFRFKDRVFQIVINGRTGELQGQRPYSAAKITLFVLMILALIALAALGIAYLKGA